MPRAPRADEAGGLYHALNRGNLRADIFLKEAEFAAFERILHEGLEIHQIELYSYQLISNHYHLVLQPLVDGEMSRFMSWIGGTHTMRYHPTRNDARYPRLVTVYYPLHPLFGRENLPVRQRSGATSGRNRKRGHPTFMLVLACLGGEGKI